MVKMLLQIPLKCIRTSRLLLRTFFTSFEKLEQVEVAGRGGRGEGGGGVRTFHYTYLEFLAPPLILELSL